MGKWRSRFEDERDRRYTDLRAADQRALQIKEEADAKALVLAAALQAEKDERRNDILQRWNDDRGTFVTREAFELAIEPLKEAVTHQQGKGAGINAAWLILVAVAMFLVALGSVIVFLVTR